MVDSQENLQLSLRMLNQGRYAEAECQAMLTEVDDPVFPVALEVVAISLQRRDRVTEALILLKYAVSLDPYNSSFH